MTAVTSRPGSAERRKWLEAEAELLSDVSGIYDEFAVDRIIALANDAQRESWIESKMDNCKKDDIERLAIDPSLAPPAQQQIVEARLDADTNRKISKLFDRLDAAKSGAKRPGSGK